MSRLHLNMDWLEQLCENGHFTWKPSTDPVKFPSQFSDEFMELENCITWDIADAERQTRLNVSHMWILAVKL